MPASRTSPLPGLPHMKPSHPGPTEERRVGQIPGRGVDLKMELYFRTTHKETCRCRQDGLVMTSHADGVGSWAEKSTAHQFT